MTSTTLQAIQLIKPNVAMHPSTALWRVEAIVALFEKPFMDLVFEAQQIHRQHFKANEVQLSTLLSIKTGGCPEDCGYCPQSAHHETPVAREPLMQVEEVLERAQAAKANGASRFCLGAAWRGPSDKDLAAVLPMIEGIKALGMETCGTFGLLREGQAEKLRDAGLDYYNHNIDTAPDKYADIISTRKFEDRLETLQQVREAGMNVCCGGIVGMGESRQQRAGLIAALANMTPPPESVPINALVAVEGTPLEGSAALDPFEFVRTIACARITMPNSYVRLSAGRENMSDEMQALCFMAGANSIFYGEKLLTTPNPLNDRDKKLFERLGINSQT